MKYLNNNKFLIISIFFFGVIFSLISLVNHYNFRTYALDLGLYTNALYDYINFQWNDSSVFKINSENLLADHFDLYLIIFSPFSLIFGTYSLLIIQILAIIAGGIGIHQYFIISGKSRFIANSATVYFYLFFGIYGALTFDYHSNVIAAMLVPWLFYVIEKKELSRSSVLILFILISKENVSLWLVFVLFGLAIEYRNDKLIRNYLLTLSLICGFYFFLVTNVIIPGISKSGIYQHFDYSILGNSPLDALIFILTNPFDVAVAFFTNHLHNPDGDFIKLELLITLLISGLPFLFWKPHYLIMLIPVFAQKLFHDNFVFWSIDGHYNIEFVPIMAIGIFNVVSRIKNRKLIIAISIFVIVLVAGATIRLMDNTIIYTDKSRIRIYDNRHYKKSYNVEKVHAQLSIIPENAIVSAQSPFLPHLSLRDYVYVFPIIKDAEYIVFSLLENPYPLSKETFSEEVDLLVKSDKWVKVINEDIVILKKKGNKVSTNQIN